MLLDRVDRIFTDDHLINKAFNLIFITGVHNEACKEWRHQPVAGKTCANFRQHVTEAHEELFELQESAQQAGYTVNMTSTNDFHECTADALLQLFAAIEEDRMTVSNLADTNQQLME
eukprot:45050-Ditylum_brightwellii.AAC.1